MINEVPMLTNVTNEAASCMQVIKHPDKSEWKSLLARPTFDTSSLNDTVSRILTDIRQEGDAAVLRYGEMFDKAVLKELRVTLPEINEAANLLSEDLKEAIHVAAKNIEKFHVSQKFETKKIETTPGVICWQKAVGIEKVGLYIPGGSAPLFSTVLMLAIPAKIAGCKEIILCTPPDKDGNINPAILYAAKMAGATSIFKVGGVQAIGAMAYGTATVPKVYKIFGPGNQYVMAAKQLVSLRDVAIDMPAGPSEVQVIADETANAAFIAADLLSQAEHGADSQVILTTTSEKVIEQVLSEIQVQLALLPRKEIAEKALKHSKAILLKNNEDIIELTNEYAPEHLIIETADYIQLAQQVVNAGSVFLGNYTPESAGDYASGTNHTLPTNGYAKAYSGVNLDSFIKKITFQEISREGIQNLGKTIEVMAENELLYAHKNAVTLRLK
ncbi:histidinol dehydrogenase [Dysgonomonas macrotermitis]|uniref:Histidinol dehydrogenase n=2 Tax=Dysgonomonas macrotermitis TaxID=1346286 RepID=A0A1M4XWC3_9BACT|nr:histidinol dehydrogenase [Dysgonomonas macrotermitis]